MRPAPTRVHRDLPHIVAHKAINSVENVVFYLEARRLSSQNQATVGLGSTVSSEPFMAPRVSLISPFSTGLERLPALGAFNLRPQRRCHTLVLGSYRAQDSRSRPPRHCRRSTARASAATVAAFCAAAASGLYRACARDGLSGENRLAGAITRAVPRCGSRRQPSRGRTRAPPDRDRSRAACGRKESACPCAPHGRSPPTRPGWRAAA
jgi:hypothetical protein